MIWALVCKASGPAPIFAESISFHEGDKEMSAQYNRDKYSGGKSFQGTRDPIPVAGLKPHNCKTPCPYGNGTTFCFPCMAKIMDEHKKLRKAA